MHSPEWITDLFIAIDKMDVEKFSSFLKQDATFRFGNAAQVAGVNNIKTGLAQFYQSIKKLSHKLLDVWEVDNAVICRGDVTYTRFDDSTVTLPFVDIFKMDDDAIADYLIYIDLAPLFQPHV
ncbi:nuclear transport factor 2 family protein [candidate division KSB1 bacterium]|nr:nuclear transport factor 2 family protein [candidate division KSB1 bacterium]